MPQSVVNRADSAQIGIDGSRIQPLPQAIEVPSSVSIEVFVRLELLLPV